MNDDDEFLDALETEESSGRNIPESLSNRFADSDRFERCGRWLQSIPRDDVVALRHTPEYEEFLNAFDRLSEAHKIILTTNRLDTQSVSETLIFTASFLQKSAMDDIVLRIFEYLDSYSLIKTSLSCSRFRDLAIQSATCRTTEMLKMRQLDHPLQLLRAREQIDGVGDNAITSRPVPVPTLCLRRRIIVTECSDADYNGIYHCTGINGNGFVFTKPRSSGTRVSENVRQTSDLVPTNWDENHRKSGELLRCIISKKYSHEVRSGDDRCCPIQLCTVHVMSNVFVFRLGSFVVHE
jgi:hypothetical protein